MRSVYAKDREFDKDITIEKNSRKKYIHIDREMGSNEIFSMLSKSESETESEIENLLEDSDTQYIAEKQIQDSEK